MFGSSSWASHVVSATTAASCASQAFLARRARIDLMTITRAARTTSRPSSHQSQLEAEVDDGAADGAVETSVEVAGEVGPAGLVVVVGADAVSGAGAGMGVGDGVGGGFWVGITASDRVGSVIEDRGGGDGDSSGSADLEGAVIESVGSSPVGRAVIEKRGQPVGGPPSVGCAVGAGGPPPSHAAIASPRTPVRTRTPVRRTTRRLTVAVGVRVRNAGSGWPAAGRLVGGAGGFTRSIPGRGSVAGPPSARLR